jgi:hypothetical protein
MNCQNKVCFLISRPQFAYFGLELFRNTSHSRIIKYFSGRNLEEKTRSIEANTDINCRGGGGGLFNTKKSGLV